MGENEQVNVIMSELEHDEWYADIIYNLKNLSCLDHLVDHKKRALRLKAMKYCLTQDGLGWKNPDGIILRCLIKHEADRLIKELDITGLHCSLIPIIMSGLASLVNSSQENNDSVHYV
jgi:hypothetical protein